MSKRLPSEFGIIMNLERFMILQQTELGTVNNTKYFDEYNPCHIYFICKRPRLSIDPKTFKADKKKINFTLQVHRQNKIEEHNLEFRNDLNVENVELVTQYPYNRFQLVSKRELLLDAKVATFIQSFPRLNISRDFIDLEVLYIGQSFGVDGARTAPDRLKNHSTLQGIYSEAITNNPDSEIWLALASFDQINITLMDGRNHFSEELLEEDRTRFPKVHNILHNEGINEQQKINFTEAALIKFFQPKYNKIYKDSFPNPAHKTYSECYDLDINSIVIELQTKEMINCKLYSEKVERENVHMTSFQLRSEKERKNMFEYFD